VGYQHLQRLVPSEADQYSKRFLISDDIFEPLPLISCQLTLLTGRVVNPQLHATFAFGVVETSTAIRWASQLRTAWMCEIERVLADTKYTQIIDTDIVIVRKLRAEILETSIALAGPMVRRIMIDCGDVFPIHLSRYNKLVYYSNCILFVNACATAIYGSSGTPYHKLVSRVIGSKVESLLASIDALRL